MQTSIIYFHVVDHDPNYLASGVDPDPSGSELKTSNLFVRKLFFFPPKNHKSMAHEDCFKHVFLLFAHNLLNKTQFMTY